MYLPPDANTFLSTMAHVLQSKGYVNLMVGSKQPSAVFLSPEEAEAHCRAGASVWKTFSTDSGLDPDVVLVGIGAEMTFEVVAAADWLQRNVPEMRVRVVNVTDLLVLESDSLHPHGLDDEAFASLFTPDRPIHFNYHGYPKEIRSLLFGRPNMAHTTIAAYDEEGSTTTPFDMMLLNKTSRFHVAINAVKGAARRNEKVALRLHELTSELTGLIRDTREYIMTHKSGAYRPFTAHDFGLTLADPEYLNDVGNLKVDTSSLSEG